MLNAKSCLIDPPASSATVATLCKWLTGGNPRGFLLRDGTLVIFDGYGNTPAGVASFFAIPSGDIEFSFIMQKNGDVATGGLKKPRALEKLFTTQHCVLFFSVAKRRGNLFPLAIPYE